MDKSYYFELAKEYAVGSDWTVRGYLDFIKLKHPAVSSTDHHIIEEALKERLDNMHSVDHVENRHWSVVDC